MRRLTVFRRTGSRARTRSARSGRGDDADDAGPPRGAGLAAAVPTLPRRSGRTRRRRGGARCWAASWRWAGHGRADRVVRRAAPARAGAGRARSRWSLSLGASAFLQLVVDAYPTTLQASAPDVSRRPRSPRDDDLRRALRPPARRRGARRAPSPICRLPPTSRRHAARSSGWLATGSRNAACRTSPAVSAKPGAWELINFIRALGRRRRREDDRTPGGSTRCSRTRLHGRRPVPWRGRAARPPRAANGPAGALTAGGLPRANERSSAVRRALRRRRRGIAVPTHASSEAIRELGSSPPVLFPVITAAPGDIVATYACSRRDLTPRS